jgi:transcriptional regulator with XRE-family HTH domain
MGLKQKEVAEQLRAKRRERGWSIERAARNIGVDPGTWAGWESGKRVVLSTHRSLLAGLFSRS